ncbi:MAG: type II toxin-antitoxin system RelE/ParE family toxin [Candidatus Rokuibacteriota bacterium]
MKQVVVRPAAAADIEDAYQWYESQRPGLGDEFLAALRLTRDRVLEHPEAFPALHRDTRRALIPQRFPYGLFFRIHGETIVVVACMHAKRGPRQWQRRT